MSRAVDKGLASCHLCTKVVDAQAHRCPRCGAALHQRKADSLQRSLALLITASVLYVPANVLPIMYTENFGNVAGNTIMGGVFVLINMGSYPIAAIIFIASIMVPIGKMAILYYLIWSVSRGKVGSEQQRTNLYRLTEIIGKWSMIDVFVVAVLVALIQLKGLIVFLPGIAAVAFAGVVIVTILSAESFDPRLIWDLAEETKDGE